MSQTDQSGESTIAPSAFEPLSGQGPAPKSSGPSWRKIPLATGIIFVAIMAFLLTARSLEIKVVALNEATVTLSGGLYLPFGERYLLRRGDYQVSANAPGYHPLVSEVTVADEDNQILELILQPLPGRLTFISKPPGAKVIIDGNTLGSTPLEDTLVEAGDHQLRIEAERYQPHEQALSVTGRDIPQQLEAALSPAWAEITINSTPSGASILADGEFLANTPAVVELLQGERQLILQKEDFADWQQALVVTAEQAMDLGTISLTPASGILNLSSTPAGANVTLNGEFQGQTPLELEMSPGRAHRISVFKPGYRRHSSSVEMAAGEHAERAVKLNAQLGEVRFNIKPDNAILRVNGRPRGSGSQTLSLPAFEQSVEVVLAGHATVRQRITPRPGLQQVINVSLKTEQESRMARIKPEITSALGQTLLLFNPGESMGEFTMGASRREPGRRAGSG